MKKEHRPGAVIERLETKFEAKLQVKASWERHEVLMAFRDAAHEVRREIIDELMSEPPLSEALQNEI